MTRDQRGASESIQWALLTPLLLLIVLGTIQVGLWLHGRTIGSHAAIAAAEEAALLTATSGQAEALGRSVAAAGGLADVRVEVHQTASTARAVVSGRMPTFFDLGQTGVSEQATRPRERVSRP